MAQWILLASLLCTAGSMSGVAGAPGISGLSPQASNAGNTNEHPKEELELESLKSGVGASNKPSSSGSESTDAKISMQSPPTPRPQMTPKPAVNMEHPAPSDNDNENSERYQAKLPVLSFSMEDKRKEMGKSNGLAADPDYTPQDIAEYIFWTGDEKGVAMALNDFVQDELVTKSDVLKFLENVKYELNALRNRYTAMTQVNPVANFPSFSPNQNAKNLLQKTRFFNDIPMKRDMPGDYSTDFSNYDSWSTTGESRKFNVPNQFMSVKADRVPSSSSSSEDLPDYEEMIEKIRQADAKFREYSLEGIIYQLAKELFSQELHEQPQRSIQRFAHFVENEAELGRIPKDLGKAVLDTLVGALVDAVSEQSGTATKSGAMSASNNLMQPKFPAGKDKSAN